MLGPTENEESIRLRRRRSDVASFKLLAGLDEAKLAISKKEVERFGLRKVRRRVYRFRQQEFSHFMRLSSSFRRYNGVKLLATYGVILLLLGIMVISFTDSFILTVPYDDNTTSVDFPVTRDVDGPFFVYAYIDNFRVNHRRWMESRPHYYGENACGVYDSVDAAHYLRPAKSIPELANFSRKDPVIPCGITSLTYFNDAIELHELKHCHPDPPHPDAPPECIGRSLTISETQNAPKELFSIYAKQPQEHLKPYQWINPLSVTRFQGWQYSSFASTFPLLIGRLRDYTIPRGYLRLTITKNLWPSDAYDARKSICLMSIGWMGSSQTFLGLVAINWGIAMVFVSLVFLWGVRRNTVFASSSLVGLSPEELREQWIAHTREWLARQSHHGNVLIPMAPDAGGGTSPQPQR